MIPFDRQPTTHDLSGRACAPITPTQDASTPTRYNTGPNSGRSLRCPSSPSGAYRGPPFGSNTVDTVAEAGTYPRARPDTSSTPHTSLKVQSQPTHSEPQWTGQTPFPPNDDLGFIPTASFNWRMEDGKPVGINTDKNTISLKNHLRWKREAHKVKTGATAHPSGVYWNWVCYLRELDALGLENWRKNRSDYKRSDYKDSIRQSFFSVCGWYQENLQAHGYAGHPLQLVGDNRPTYESLGRPLLLTDVALDEDIYGKVSVFIRDSTSQGCRTPPIISSSSVRCFYNNSS